MMPCYLRPAFLASLPDLEGPFQLLVEPQNLPTSLQVPVPPLGPGIDWIWWITALPRRARPSNHKRTLAFGQDHK